MDAPIVKTELTYRIDLFIAGPIEVAKQIIRKEAIGGGLCVTITPTDYIYRGGEEAGYVVGLLNYPRFPDTPETLRQKAQNLLIALLTGTYQKSALMVTPEASQWFSMYE